MRTNQLLYCIFLIVFSFGCASANTASISPIELYVAPTGSDQADGRSSTIDNEGLHGPFATLIRARDELRRLRNKGDLPNGATVNVREGTYELSDVFLLETQDSGSLKEPIIFRAYKDEIVKLSGGRQLSDCKTISSKLVTCNTSTLKLNELDAIGLNKRLLAAPLPPFEVFDNEKRLQLARWPNSDRNAPGGDTWAYVSSAAKGALTNFIYHGVPTGISNLSKNAVIHIWPGNDWFDEYIGISNTSPSNFTLAEPTTYPIQPGRRFSILNVPETMDAPGEWYYSAETQELSIIPIPDLNDHAPVVSYLDSIIDMRDAYNIRLEGFIIENSRKTAVTITGGRSNTLENCIIRNTGGYGIEIRGGSHHNIIESEIHDTGYGGIVLKGGDRKTLIASGHNAISNNIHHTGILVRTGIAALSLSGVGNTGRHNRIHNTPGLAVSINGNDHILELNDISHACEQSSDCGAVYTGRDWTFHGNVIRHNRIHDIYGYGMKRINTSAGIVDYARPHDASGVYLDDAVSGIDVIGNVFYRIPGKMIQIGGGRDNTIDNNIFITNSSAIWMNTRGPDAWYKNMLPRLNAVPYKGPVWRNRFPQTRKTDAKSSLARRQPDHTQHNSQCIYHSNYDCSVKIYDSIRCSGN